MKIGKSLVLQIVVSVALLGAVVWFAGPSQLESALLSVRLEWLALFVISIFCLHLLMAKRITMILKYLGEKPDFVQVLLCHFSGMLASDFTPARSGYFATALALKANNGTPIGKAFVSILGPQLFDFALKAVVGALAVLLLFSAVAQKSQQATFVIELVACAMLAMIAIGFAIMFSKRVLRLFAFAQKLPFGNLFYTLFEKLQENAHAIKGMLGWILAFLATTFLIKGLGWWALAQSLGINAQLPLGAFGFFLLLNPLISMLEFVPLPTLAGMGLSEAGIIGVLGLFGVNPAVAATFALLNRATTIGIDTVFGWKYASLTLGNHKKLLDIENEETGKSA